MPKCRAFPDTNVNHCGTVSAVPQPLLDGVSVVDLAGAPAAMTGRILADLGADVVRVGAPLGGTAGVAWDHGKRAATEAELPDLLASADVVVTTPGWQGTVDADPAAAPNAVWVSVTPFGLDGPRAHWRATDLGVMASTGNMFATGDPDRAPVRCTERASWSHTGPEAAFAALTGLASGRPQRIDVSMQEIVMVASMGAAGRYFRNPQRGKRVGASVGRTREIWPCKDGYVSFGLRGGKARVPTLQKITELVGHPVLVERDWTTYNHNKVSDDELRAIEDAIAPWFAERTMAELYEIACETNLMLAPANSPRELYASAQLAARDFFDDDGLPRSFVKASVLAAKSPRDPRASRGQNASGRGAWSGTNVLEFGSGAAGPIATRYFAEHGATVIKIESRLRPDFLRTYGAGLDEADMFDALNAGKLSLTLNMKHPRGLAIAKRLAFDWADAISENFAPKAMRGFGMDYETLAAEKPDLVMISACLQGQTGPHRNYPGFGGQGAALSGFNFLTGWPDRAPLGPFGTITDSLAPRFVAAALAAGILYRRRTGNGVYLDLSQVEAAAWSLSPWLLEYHRNGRILTRQGDGDDRAVVHGAFPCAGDDRWVAIAAWDVDEAERLAKVAGDDIAAWTSQRSPVEAAEALQAAGVEAVPVADFGDAFEDPQLHHRDHFVTLEHPVMGEGRYERNGFRVSDAESGYTRASPTLGQDNDQVLGEILGLSAAEREQLASEGVLE